MASQLAIITVPVAQKRRKSKYLVRRESLCIHGLALDHDDEEVQGYRTPSPMSRVGPEVNRMAERSA